MIDLDAVQEQVARFSYLVNKDYNGEELTDEERAELDELDRRQKAALDDVIAQLRGAGTVTGRFNTSEPQVSNSPKEG